jgi:hypothetical protein
VVEAAPSEAAAPRVEAPTPAAQAPTEAEAASVVSLEGLPPDEAAALVWQRLRALAASAAGPGGVAALFARFDADGSGTLDAKEVKAALAHVGLPGASNKVTVPPIYCSVAFAV